MLDRKHYQKFRYLKSGHSSAVEKLVNGKPAHVKLLVYLPMFV